MGEEETQTFGCKQVSQEDGMYSAGDMANDTVTSVGSDRWSID